MLVAGDLLKVVIERQQLGVLLKGGCEGDGIGPLSPYSVRTRASERSVSNTLAPSAAFPAVRPRRAQSRVHVVLVRIQDVFEVGSIASAGVYPRQARGLGVRCS
jgi:hypothetical protein